MAAQRSRKDGLCTKCGHKLKHRRWFRKKGITHYSIAYGWQSFAWCPDCDEKKK